MPRRSETFMRKAKRSRPVVETRVPLRPISIGDARERLPYKKPPAAGKPPMSATPSPRTDGRGRRISARFPRDSLGEKDLGYLIPTMPPGVVFKNGAIILLDQR